MRTTIDAAGRLVVPDVMRDELGFRPGMEVEIDVVDGLLEVAIPSRVRVEETRGGPVLVTDDASALVTADEIRALVEDQRR